MIRLEGPTLPQESQGAIPPILIGDHRDVPWIPLQVGHQAVLADNCGIDETVTVLLLSGPDILAVLAAVTAPTVVQIDEEWLLVSAVVTSPPSLVIGERDFGGTVAAEHAKGAAVLFLETRPLGVFAYVPDGCRYPDDAIDVRVNDNAEVPAHTIRLQDARIVDGERLTSVEFDTAKYFNAPPPVPVPTTLVLTDAPVPGRTRDGAVRGFVAAQLRTVGSGQSGRSQGARLLGWDMSRRRALPPPPPASLFGPLQADGTDATTRTVQVRQTPLGRVAADHQGLRDTPAGRYTGTPNGPIETPAHVVRLILEHSFGETDPARFHQPTWDATATAQAAIGLTWRLRWTGASFEEFRALAQACGQADLFLDEAGRWRYQFRDPTEAAVATLTARELVGDAPLGWSAGREVVTVLDVTWGDGVEGGAFTLTNPAMLRRHDRNVRALALPWAATEPVARRLARYVLSQLDQPRLTTSATPTHAFLGLTLRDRVFVETDIIALYGQRRVPWEIWGVTDRGDVRVLGLHEADPLALSIPLSCRLLVPGDYFGDGYFGGRYFGDGYFR